MATQELSPAFGTLELAVAFSIALLCSSPKNLTAFSVDALANKDSSTPRAAAAARHTAGIAAGSFFLPPRPVSFCSQTLSGAMKGASVSNMIWSSLSTIPAVSGRTDCSGGLAEGALEWSNSRCSAEIVAPARLAMPRNPCQVNDEGTKTQRESISHTVI